MKTIRIAIVATIAVTATLANTAFAGECSAGNNASPATATAGKDLVGVASGANNFKTLVAAVKAAGLVETLQGKGPFTVFAPTDEAFAKLPAGTLDDLLKPENREKLASILKYHIVPGKVMAADVRTMEAKTAQGQSVKLKVTSEGVTVDGAKVVQTDILAANGVIHVIDRVILPSTPARDEYGTAPYRVLRQEAEVELRDYPALVVAQTRVRGMDGGFMRLFRYISGSNAEDQKIPMTTPVFMSGEANSQSMAFVMPKDMSITSTPKPVDSAVTVSEIPGGKFATLRFGGGRSEANQTEALSRLRAWLNQQNLRAEGSPIYAYYDDPMTPLSQRRNEVLLRLASDQPGV